MKQYLPSGDTIVQNLFPDSETTKSLNTQAHEELEGIEDSSAMTVTKVIPIEACHNSLKLLSVNFGYTVKVMLDA